MTDGQDSVMVSENENYRPDMVAFQTGQDKSTFTAIVATDGLGKGSAGKVTLTSTLFRKTLSGWPGKPVFANHNPAHVIGNIVSADLNDDGDLVMQFSLDDENAADIVRNDAFNGFSIAYHPAGAKISEGVLMDANPYHLSLQFFSSKPHCKKDECHVMFSDNGCSRSCLCEEGVEVDDIVGFQFKKDNYSVESAQEWVTSWMEEHDCTEGNFELSEDDDLITVTSPKKERSDSDAFAVVDTGINAIIAADNDPIDSTISEAEDLFSVSISDNDDRAASEEDTQFSDDDGGEDDDPMTDDDDADPSEGEDEEPEEEEAEEEEEEEEEEESSEEEEESEEPEGEVEKHLQKVKELEEKLKEASEKADEADTLKQELEDMKEKKKEAIVRELPDPDELPELRERWGLDESQNWRALDLDDLEKLHGTVTVLGKLEVDDDGGSSSTVQETTVEETAGTGDEEPSEEEERIAAARERFAQMYKRRRGEA